MNKITEISFDMLLKNAKRYPLELFLCIALFILEETGTKSFPPFLILITLIFNEARANNKWAKAVYWITLLLPIAFIFIPMLKDWFGEMQNMIAYIALPIVILLIKKAETDKDFMYNAYNWGASVLLGLSVFAVFIAIALFQLAISFVFEIKINDSVYKSELLLFETVFYPFALLTFHSQIENFKKGNVLFSMLINYVLTPFVILFTFVPYLYIIVTIIKWKLINGQVGYVFSGYMTLTIIAYGCHLLTGEQKKWSVWFYRNISKLLIAPLILYFVCVGIRIYNYGFTELRYYALLLGIIITISIIFLFNSAHRHALRNIARATLIIIILSTYIPGITAKEIEQYSQNIYSSHKNVEALYNKSFDSKSDTITLSSNKGKNTYITIYAKNINMNISGYNRLQHLEYLQIEEENGKYVIYNDDTITYTVEKSWLDSLVSDAKNISECDSLVYITSESKMYINEIRITSKSGHIEFPIQLIDTYILTK